MKTRRIFVTLSLALLFILSCNYIMPQATAEPTSVELPPATVIVEPTAVPTRSDLPRDEAAVPRVSVEQAKVALDSGAAIIVDVRGAQAYELEHIVGSISIPLSNIELNPTGLELKKDEWIITYCT